MQNINCRKIGIALAVLFLVGLMTSTIYSRTYAERQKPYVHVVGTESRSFSWVWDSESSLEVPESGIENFGFDWSVEIVVSEENYSFYMDTLMVFPGMPVEIFVDFVSISGVIVQHFNIGNGDVTLTIGFNNQGVNLPPVGAVVRVRLEILFNEQWLRHMVPDYAVHYDRFENQYYIYVVNRRDGMWGREFFIQQQVVTLGVPQRVEHLLNILGSDVDFRLPIVTWSDGVLYDGAIVRLSD